jgi:hypothetical protein
MSIAQVTIADLARKLDCDEADIKAWFESEQCPTLMKQYDEALSVTPSSGVEKSEINY